MNRRDFLQSLLVGSAIVAAPRIYSFPSSLFLRENEAQLMIDAAVRRGETVLRDHVFLLRKPIVVPKGLTLENCLIAAQHLPGVRAITLEGKILNSNLFFDETQTDDGPATVFVKRDAALIGNVMNGGNLVFDAGCFRAERLRGNILG